MANTRSALALLVAVTLLLSSSPLPTSALTCNQLLNALYPCLNYMMGASITSNSPCCRGVRSALSATGTRQARQVACRCLKSIATTPNPTYVSRAQNLPQVCDVNIPYAINPNVDCSRVG